MSRLALSVLLFGLSASQGMATDFEFVPFVGYRYSGGFEWLDANETLDQESANSWGVVLGRSVNDNSRYELLYSQQETNLADTTDPNDAFDLRVHYVHLGGTIDVTRNRFTPFFSGGVDMTHLSPTGYGLDNETHFSLSVGGGLKWYPTDSLGLRFEVRGYGTVSDGSGTRFCEGVDCNLRYTGDLTPQLETNLGLIFRF
ncbi:MAG: outer membrane beta-barrel protein [Chromatiales bacterium]|jgi:opacity protein-like surface antigen